MVWTYRGEEFNISDYPEAFGFVYRITYTDYTFYIGKKNLFDKVVLPKNSNRTKKEIIWRESNSWKSYIGSSKLTNGLKIESKEIIYIANTKRALTYLETKALFEFDAIFDVACHNKNINGMWFDNVLEPLKVPLKKQYR